MVIRAESVSRWMAVCLFFHRHCHQRSVVVSAGVVPEGDIHNAFGVQPAYRGAVYLAAAGIDVIIVVWISINGESLIFDRQYDSVLVWFWPLVLFRLSSFFRYLTILHIGPAVRIVICFSRLYLICRG